VTIEDHGPFAKDRVVDLAPAVADQLDLTHRGVTAVEIRPVTVPLPDGGVKLGAGAADATPEAVHQAVEVTKQLTEPPTAGAAGR
jgi:rare lipoprotein A